MRLMPKILCGVIVATVALFILSCNDSGSNPAAPQTYTVTYNGNGNTGGTAPVDAGAYAAGAAVTAKTNSGLLVKTGSVFAGWNTVADGSGTSYAEGAAFIIGSANIVLYAKWTIVQNYSVTYNGNGNTGGAVPVDAGAYATGATVTVKTNSGALVKTGSTFAGWNSAANGAGTSYAEGATFAMGSANIVLYAKWTTGQNYSVTYNGNGNTGGIVPVDSNRYSSGASVTTKNNSGLLVKTGFTFASWNTAADGTGTDYPPNYVFSMGGANLILYAKWIAVAVAVAPALLAPANLATYQSWNSLPVRWSKVNLASNYIVQVSLSSAFSPPISNDTTTDTSMFLQVQLLSNTVYYWRARTITASGTSAWSAANSFTTTSRLQGKWRAPDPNIQADIWLSFKENKFRQFSLLPNLVTDLTDTIPVFQGIFTLSPQDSTLDIQLTDTNFVNYPDSTIKTLYTWIGPVGSVTQFSMVLNPPNKPRPAKGSTQTVFTHHAEFGE